MLRFPRRHPFVWATLRPFWPSYLWIAGVLLFQILLSVLAPLPTKFILNDLLRATPAAPTHVELLGLSLGTHSAETAIYLLTGLTVLLAGLLVGAVWLEQLGLSNLLFRARENLRRDLLARFFTRRQTYLDSKKKVDLVGRFSGDVENTEILLVNGFPALVRDLPILFVMLAMMFTVNVRLTLIFAALLPLAVWAAQTFTKQNRAASKLLRRQIVRFEEESYETLSAMAIVKSLRSEERVEGRLKNRIRELTGLARAERNAALSLATSLDGSAAIIKAAFILFGGLAIFRRELGWGDLFQILAYVEIFSRHVNNLTKFVSKYPKAMASVDRLEELHADLDAHPEASGNQPVDHGAIATAPAPLQFFGVSLRHEGGPLLLQDFTHAFARGEVVAIVGASGIGKSSFSRLLNRLGDPAQGRIELGGVPLPAYPVRELRRAVRIISQESFLLAGSVRENLQLGSSRDVSDAEMERALAAVNAWDFVRALPAGLSTIIGEAGQQLSGGQAKRIHLARAFLDRESSIVLFDEPTTGLDPHSAGIVVEAIRLLRAEKSVVFWITHRMEELKSADRALYFTAAAPAAIGSVASLLQKNAGFRALVQSGELRPRDPVSSGQITPHSSLENRALLSTIDGGFAKNGAGL